MKKSKFEMLLTIVLACIILSSCEEKQLQSSGSNAELTYTNVLLKSFQGTTHEAATQNANNWLIANSKLKVISVSFNTTAEPSTFYQQGNYPGFKYTVLIAYKK